jgi:adenylosuccinate lyase
LIPRYTLPEMGRVWSDENRFQKWLEVELAATDTLAEAGLVPQAARTRIRQQARIDVARIQEIEARVRHDMIAFTMAVGESIGDAQTARWLHYGLTSNDVIDTAQALLVGEASRLIQAALERWGQVLERRAHEFQHTPQIGRTHGIHAEPITFGLKIATWYAENRRNLRRFSEAAEQMAVGKISGAVGNAAHLGTEIEEKICARLGLAVDPVTSQVISRDRHAQYLSTLALIAASLEKIALEIRHLQRTEVREAEEPFGSEQRGSSAMPHKRNPVNSEQVCGLARVVRSNSLAALENVALWHERDISHSSVERVILPDASLLACYVLRKGQELTGGLVIHADRARRRLLSESGGLVFSQSVLLAMVAADTPRDQAYRIVQEDARRASEEGRDFREVLEEDPKVRLTKAQMDEAFDLERMLRHTGRFLQALEPIEDRLP